MWCIWFFHIGLLGSVISQLAWDFNPDEKSAFHAYILEKNLEVSVYPPLHVKLPGGSTLCRLVLLPTKTHTVPQFITTEIIDSKQGRGQLVLNESALYSARVQGDAAVQSGMFHLKIYAEDCNTPPKITRPWTLNVILVPTDLPVWSERQYTFTVPSTVKAGEIIGKVTSYAAFDFDVDPEDRLGDDTGMCGYIIEEGLSADLFDIDGHGVIRSRTQFDQHNSGQYQINVTGFDCHTPEKRHSTTPVTIIVRVDCQSHWDNIPNEIKYPTLAPPKPIASAAYLNTCPYVNNSCELKEAVLRVKLLWNDRDPKKPQLEVPNPSTTCDLDPLSLRVQREFCGVNSQNLRELLPQNQLISDTLDFVENGFNLSKVVHAFNGTNQWIVTEGQLPLEEHRLDNIPFTLSFWMNHSSKPASVGSAKQNDVKENIICSTDGQDKNRHHFAVFLHNCKLTVLLRREPIDKGQHELYQLYPTQWRFKLDEICDTQWHHYSLVYKPPSEEVVKGMLKKSVQWNSADQMRLYVDGFPVPSDPDIVRVSEDLPLKHLKRPVELTRMSVGACWHSKLGKFVQHFSGQLAGLTLSRGMVENDDVLQCLVNCYPRLHAKDPDSGRVHFADFPELRVSQLENLIVEVSQISELTEAIRKVVFYTPRLWKRPEERIEPTGIHISTEVRYKDPQCPSVNIPDHTVRIIYPEVDKAALATLLITPVQHSLIPSVSLNLVSHSSSVSHTLSLTSKDNEKPQSISPEDLHHGVSIFPSISISWDQVPTGPVTWNIAPNGPISFCDLIACLAQSSVLETEEKLMISQHPNLHLEPFSNGIRLTGPTVAQNFVQALRHAQWIDTSFALQLKERCFQLYCVAEFESADATGSTHQLRIQSNTVRARFIVSGQTDVENVSENAAAAHQDVATFQEPRVPRSVIPQIQPTIQDQVGLWNYKEQFTYVLIGGSIAVLVVITILAVVIGLRIRGNNKRPLLPSGWKPSSRHAVQATNRRINAANAIHPSSSVQVVVNPVSNQKEVEELERKFCFYDRQVYDGDAEDTYDLENATDINEDISDFETPLNSLMDKPITRIV